MARKRSPARDEARALWEQDHTRTLKSIAEELGVEEKRVYRWKYEDKWEKGKSKRVTTPNQNRVYTVSKETDKKLIAAVESNEELTDEQRAFCLYYVKSFNATRSYQKAYGCTYDAARTNGSRLLAKDYIKAELVRLKELRSLSLMADAEDVVILHMRIAFSDITDYVEFGRATVAVMGPFGPITVKNEYGESEEITREINEVRFRESSDVDGRLIAEVKQGRDGASVKLVDKQKSLAFLERYFELNPMDKHRKDYDNARLELERHKQDEVTEVEDDGFIEALTSAAQEVWDEDKSDIPV